MKELEELLQSVGMMIHELRDADKISNEEEEYFVDVLGRAKVQLSASKSVIRAARFIAANSDKFSEYDRDGVKRLYLNSLREQFSKLDSL